MKPSLKNPKLNVERAKEHLEVLDTALVKIQDLKPFRVTHYENPEHTHYVISSQIPIIDLRLAILAGDAIYSLRSALDHIAWQLALTTKDRPFDRTEFPIVGEDTSENMRRFKRVTQDIPVSAVNEIKALQPYQRGTAYKDDLLWKLDKLCNIDKHRVIPAQGTAIDFKLPKSLKSSDCVFGTLDDAHIVAVPIAFKAEMQLAPPPTPDILLGSEVDELVVSIRELAKIYKYVRDSVIPRFACFFTE